MLTMRLLDTRASSEAVAEFGGPNAAELPLGDAVDAVPPGLNSGARPRVRLGAKPERE